jgi:hypothetical protein
VLERELLQPLVAHAAAPERVRVDGDVAHLTPGLAGATVGSANSCLREARSASRTSGSTRKTRTFSHKIR